MCNKDYMKVGGEAQHFTLDLDINDDFLKKFVKSQWPVRNQNSKLGTL